jgi:hypothetical protein
MRELDEKQQVALLALINGSTRKDAALAAGVSESTLYRYLSEPTFQTALRQKRQEMFETALDELFALTVKANETLRRNLNCGHAPTETRAANVINSLAIRASELRIAERLDAIEAALNLRKEIK